MWPLRKKPIISISLNTNNITCTVLESTNNKQFFIKAFTSINFEIPVIKNGTILNNSSLINEIKQFLSVYNIKKGYTLLSLAHPEIIERVISLHREIPQNYHLQQDENPKPLIWDFISLGYNRKSGKILYYLCGITREQLFHYQLLALTTKLNCIAIIPQRFACIKASTFLFPENPELDSIVNHASLQSYLHYTLEKASLDNIFNNYEQYPYKKDLFESLGLFCIGNQLYEKY